jgi:fatty-acyl-CoA synthase
MKRSHTTADRGIGSWVDRRAQLSPERPALVHGDVSWTYAELASRVRRLANGLRAQGVGRGDRVGWLGANHPAFLELLLATAQLGAVLAPVNHRIDAEVIRALLEDYAAEVVVVERSAEGVGLPACVRLRVGVGTTTGDGIDYEKLIVDSPDDPLDVAVGLDDLCLMPHTSGTTGRPKGVMLTHGNVTWNVVNLLSVADFRSDDVTVAIAPFFRTGGTGVNVLPALFKGGTVVVPQRADPDAILEIVDRRRVTIGFGNPDLLDALVHAPRWATADLSTIRFCITGGAPVPERLIRTYQDRGVTLLQGYGLSEAAPFVLLLDPANALRKTGSAGKAPLFVDVRTGESDGSERAVRETGELLVRGPNVMAGYWNDPGATRATIDDDGWLHTGDAARIDEDGYVWIVDRISAAYRAAGHTVYPGDVERVLIQHPTLVDAAVVAHDGSATAFVVLAADQTLDEHGVLAHCRKHLPAYAVPASVRAVERLPRSSVGKLLRHELARFATGDEPTTSG